MKCKDIERLLIDSSEEDLSAEKLAEIKQHVLVCAKCAHFQKNLKKVRNYIKEMTVPVPSDELVRKIHSACIDKMSNLNAVEKRTSGQNHLKSIPAYMWAALICLIILTVIWIIPLLRDFKLNETLSHQTIIVLSLMIQNAVMLLFSPILIRRYRTKNRTLGFF